RRGDRRNDHRRRRRDAETAREQHGEGRHRDHRTVRDLHARHGPPAAGHARPLGGRRARRPLGAQKTQASGTVEAGRRRGREGCVSTHRLRKQRTESNLWREVSVPKLRERFALLALIGLAALVYAAGFADARPTAGSTLPSGTYKIGFVESITGRLAFYDP